MTTFHPPHAPILTARQMDRLKKLPSTHKVVDVHDGEPVVRAPNGLKHKLRRDGRLAAVETIQAVQSQLHASD